MVSYHIIFQSRSFISQFHLVIYSNPSLAFPFPLISFGEQNYAIIWYFSFLVLTWRGDNA